MHSVLAGVHKKHGADSNNNEESEVNYILAIILVTVYITVIDLILRLGRRGPRVYI